MPHFGTRHVAQDPDPVNPVRFFMEAVIGQFIDHIQKNKNTAGQSDGQSQYIDKTVSEMFEEVAEGNLYDVCNHSSVGLAGLINTTLQTSNSYRRTQ